jgi:DNA-binding PadR family transcriptional regulator
MLDRAGLGRFAETARLVLAALRDGPRQHVQMFDEVRALDGPVGPGTLYGTVARLERLGIIESISNGAGGRRAYRLIGPGRADELVGKHEGIEA